MTRWYRILALFFGILWREWEPKSCGIPEEYRAHYRITLRDALSICRTVY